MKKAGVSSILFIVILLSVAVIAEAQQAGKIFRIGFWIQALLLVARSSWMRFDKS